MSEKVPDEIVRELRNAAKTRDERAFAKAIDRHKRDLPEDLLEAKEDHRVLKETMNLFNQGMADVRSEGVRLNTDHCDREERKKH